MFLLLILHIMTWYTIFNTGMHHLKKTYTHVLMTLHASSTLKNHQKNIFALSGASDGINSVLNLSHM